MSGDLPQVQAANNAKISGEKKHDFLIPSPVPTRRNRTYSQTEESKKDTLKVHCGKVKEFCRNKGHGFIINDETKESIFVHISDIDGEYVPKEGDDVTYKVLKLPLNHLKSQAVHVRITHLAPGVSHETWNPSSSPNHSPRS